MATDVDRFTYIAATTLAIIFSQRINTAMSCVQALIARKAPNT